MSSLPSTSAASFSASQPPVMGVTRVGPYVLEKRVGGGGMGEVFRAIDSRLDRPVALKRIRAALLDKPRAARRFMREARAAASIEHAHIVRIHDWIEQDGHWLVMEWVDGSVLSRWLDSRPRSLPEKLTLAIDLASALDTAHRNGFVHRDLKASNVMVDGRGRAKLLDFGLAKRLADEGEESLTLEGQIVGTPYAMSPEQAMGRKVDHRTDLFSLGSLLYEMSTGVAPFRGSTAADSLGMVCTHRPPPAGEVATMPMRLSSLITRLLEKDPARRPASSSAVLAEVRRCFSELVDGRDVARKGEAGSASGAASAQSRTASTHATVAEGTPGSSTLHRSGSSSERRHLTVLCLRLFAADDSGIGVAPSLEALGRLPHAKLEALVRATVERYGGHIEHLRSDLELIACFGFPRIHEDDAERAVRAALELDESLSEALPSDLRLEARSTLHSGPAVIVGDDVGLLQFALGSTVDRAQALLTSMDEGGVWISDEARQQLRRPFTTETVGACGAQRVLGLAESSSLWAGCGLIAREAELDLLLQRCDDAWNHQKSHIVILHGDAGIGKSTLLAELRRRLEDMGAEWWMVQGATWASHSPLQPLLEPLRRQLALVGGDGRGGQGQTSELALLTRALEERLGEDLDAATVVPLLASLLGISWQEHFADLGWAAKKRRQQTFAALTKLLKYSSRQRPLALVVEDLHWIDSSTLEWLAQFAESLGGHRVVILTTARPQFEKRLFEGLDERRLTELHLDRLAPADMATLVERISEHATLADEVRQHILDKAEGVPLFAEELTRAILESDQLEERGGVLKMRGESLVLPATLESSIVARLDRLGSAKTVAQLASVIGREFSHRLLEILVDIPGLELEKAISSLIQARLVHRRGFSMRRRYLFRHALVQDAAYGSLLGQQKRELHHRVAGLIEEHFPQTSEGQPELLAHHFTEAEAFDRAVGYWQRAGQDMFNRSAVVEAASHLEKGVSLISKLEEGEDRDQIELSLQSTLGTVLATTEGFSSAKARSAYARALDLCAQDDESERRFWSLKGISQAYLCSARHSENLAICQRLMEWANARSEPIFRVTSSLALSAQLFTIGELEQALAVADQGIATDSIQRRHHYAQRMSMDPGVNLLSMSGRILWYLGCTEEAFERIRIAEEFALSLEHPGSLANVYHCKASLHYELRQPEQVLLHTRRVIDISRKQGTFYEHWSSPLLCWAEGMIDPDCGPARKKRLRDRLEKAMQHKLEMGFLTWRPLYLCMLAQLWLLEPAPRRSLECLNEALRLMDETGEGLHEMDALCLKGTVLAKMSGHLDEAEQTLRLALELAKAKKSVPLERRARALLDTWVPGHSP